MSSCAYNMYVLYNMYVHMCNYVYGPCINKYTHNSRASTNSPSNTNIDNLIFIINHSLENIHAHTYDLMLYYMQA